LTFQPRDVTCFSTFLEIVNNVQDALFHRLVFLESILTL
jgi:hypothetical protein